ncbi:hypothetical protein [Nocardia testacea]|uniref:hypothetical protein n=1 Tax=Nocardia testacea TaxID=248551 RepID=UPI000319C01C|nr:hypothetical protein [Nocardia testacea]
MRNIVRGGILAVALLAAPVATATAAPAGVPLELPRAAERAGADDTGLVCTMQYPPTLPCLLASLSAG